MTAVASLSSAQPPVLSISSQSIGLANFGKSLADFLFNKNLLVKYIDTQNPLPANGLLASGVYACLAADTQEDYQSYLDSKLKWNGAVLSYDGQPVSKISYFIIEVAYKHRIFADPLNSLSFSATRSWASLYQLAQREIPLINDAASAKKSLDDIQSHLNDARTLLDADPDFTSGEKDAIGDAEYTKINNDYHQRLVRLGLATFDTAAAQSAAALPQPVQIGGANPIDLPIKVNDPQGPRPNLRTADPAEIQFHSDTLANIRKQGVNSIGGPGHK
jgi:hypothetical protein